MHLIQSTLTHKILRPRKETSEYHPALVLLHGRGANEDDLLGLSDYLDERFFFIAARAPFNFQWGGGFTWYEVLEIDETESKMFNESYQRLVQFHYDIKEKYPIDPSKIFYLGFSMGTIMSYALALTMPNEIKGVVANSGLIPEQTSLNFLWEKLDGASFFIAHGTYDPVISVEFGRRAKFLLEQAKADVVYREYPMAHQISEESLNDMSIWLTKKLEC